MAKKAAGKKKPKLATKKSGLKVSPAAVASLHKHEKMRIGVRAKGNPLVPFKADGVTANTFLVYGDKIGTRSASKKSVELSSSNFDWNPPTDIRNSGANALEITAKCSPKAAMHKSSTTSDDDLTVTIIFDDGLNPPDTTDCTFDDVPYEP